MSAEGPPVTLVTGSSRGLGAALVRHYVTRGHRVVGCSRTAPPAEPTDALELLADVTDEAQVREVVTEIRRRYGRLDHLINNAGIAAMNHALTTPAATVEAILRTNVLGTFLFAREGARLMQKGRFGRIVNLTSVAVPLKLEGESAYAASKAAVESLTETLARELAPMGITVNAVGPVPVETDLIRGVPSAKIDAIVARQAIQRRGTAEDVINVVDFFLSPASGMVTGQTLYLGGV